MTAFAPKLFLPRLLFLLVALPCLLPLIGCATGRSNLTLTSKQDHQRYRQGFSHAYASRNGEGDLDVVLVDDSAPLDRAKNEAAHSDASTTGAIRQIMHIRVLYQPMRGTRADHPSATNATLHWYVFGDGSDGTAEVLEYGGAGFVQTSQTGKVTKLDVRNATLKPLANHGDLTDPIGPAALRGTIVARTDSKKVNDLLAEVKSTVVLAGGREARLDAR